MADQLNKYFNQIKVIQPGDRVFKDECVCSFDTPESPDGLYINMKTFEAVGADFLDYHFGRYNYAAYLNHRQLKYKKNKPESTDNKPKRLAIGLEGGFDPDAASKDFHIEDTYSVVIMPDRIHIPLPNPDLPELVLQSVSSIISAESAENDTTTNNVWDGEQRKVSKFAQGLEQLPNPPKIPASNWKCEECDLKENLWLNLTDGSILCGRRFFDGSGGNNHAVYHYEKCKYPLAVKLGTITANGADVYSYPEDDMVIDPELDKHLAHFGINVQNLTKTEKSMLELEIDINEKLGEWSLIQEEGKNLEPVTGAGFTGLINLGNSCYMNSVLQVLFSIQEFQRRYFPPVSVYNFCDGPHDFNYQMAKLSYGLLSSKYSIIDPATKQQKGISPKSFKQIVCGSDRNFSTKRQQDAHEFYLFLVALIEKHDKDGRLIDGLTQEEAGPSDPSKCLGFVIEDRIQCSQSKRVKYTHRVECCLSLHVDLDLATNKAEYEAYKLAISATSDGSRKQDTEVVRPKIPLLSCLELFAKTEQITDFYSSAIKSRTTAEKQSKISRFPRILVLQMKKFQCGPDLVPKKMDVAFDVPDILDLEPLEGKGLQPTECELEDEDTDASAFGSGERLGESSSAAGSNQALPDSEAIATLLSMGIDMDQAIEALKVCNNDAQRAIEYIFDPDSFRPAPTLTVAARPDPMKMVLFGPDTQPKLYQLKAFISHMGPSTVCGHYVCHIRKDDRWYIFNDSKVALSENPPKEFGYLYVYERNFK